MVPQGPSLDNLSNTSHQALEDPALVTFFDCLATELYFKNPIFCYNCNNTL